MHSVCIGAEQLTLCRWETDAACCCVNMSTVGRAPDHLISSHTQLLVSLVAITCRRCHTQLLVSLVAITCRRCHTQLLVPLVAITCRRGIIPTVVIYVCHLYHLISSHTQLLVSLVAITCRRCIIPTVVIYVCHLSHHAAKIVFTVSPEPQGLSSTTSHKSYAVKREL